MTKACPSRSSRARGPGGQGASEQPFYPARPPAGQYPESFYFSWVTGPSKKFIKPVDSFLEKDNHTHTPLGGCMHAHMHKHTCAHQVHTLVQIISAHSRKTQGRARSEHWNSCRQATAARVGRWHSHGHSHLLLVEPRGPMSHFH